MNLKNIIIAIGFTTLSSCGSGEPFDYVKVCGTITYDDGSLIPVDPLVLSFFPQEIAPDGKSHPRPGSAIVDKSNGRFDSVTSHHVGDGLARGKFKVMLKTPGAVPLTPSIVPPEYCDMNRTPLVVDTTDAPFELKVRKPH